MEADCRKRAIDLIKNNFGSLKDLPAQVIQVIWVISYRASEVSIKIEAAGGIVKSLLSNGGHVAYEFEMSINKIEFLKTMVPIIRESKSDLDRIADIALLTDILKWNITEASNMTDLMRFIRRKISQADSMYYSSIPDEIL